jgi:Flp pilus assembly pilin Flp
LIYKLYPSTKVFIDGRSDFYGAEFSKQYLDVMNVQHGWQKSLDKYRIDTIVIAPTFALTQTLKISPDWRIVYDDGVAVVFRRIPGGPASLVSSDDGNIRDRAITKTITRDHPITQPTTKEENHKMKSMFTRFLKDEQGQDLIEYTLLMAFVALASAAIFVNAGASIKGIWGTASSQLSNANTLAS